MREQTATLDRASRRPHARPRYVAQLELTAPTPLTLRFSDGYLTALGEEWLPYVLSFGSVAESMGAATVNGQPASASITFIDDKPLSWLGKARLSALIRTPLNTAGTYEFSFAKLTVSQLLDGEVARREVFYLEEFRVEKADAERPARITFAMSDLSLAIENRPLLPLIERAALRDASPTALGKRGPALFGALSAYPLLAVQAGWASRLTGPLPLASGPGTAVTMLDPEGAPADDRWLGQIEAEVILWQGKSAGQPVILKRAQNGTKAALHPAGATILELRQGAKAYKWLAAINPGLGRYAVRRKARVGDHNVQAATGILTGLQVDYDDREILPGWSCVTFSLPGVGKLPNLAPPPTPGVTPFSVTLKTTTPGASAVLTVPSGTPLKSFVASVTAAMPPAPAGTIKGVTYRVTYALVWAASCRTASISANGQVLESANFPLSSGTRTREFTAGSYGSVEINFGLTFFQSDTPLPGFVSLRIVACEATVSGENRTATAPKPTTTEDTGAQSTAEAIWGQLTASLDGLQDDTAGTVSGAASQWLTNPADVTKLVLLALYPGTGAADFGPTFPVTRASLSAAGIVWAAVIDGAIPFSQLRAKLGDQGRAVVHLEEGRWEYPYLAHDPVAVHTFEAARNDVTAIAFTPRTELVTSLKVLSAPDYRKGTGSERFTRVKILEDLTQPGLTDRIQQELELDFIADPVVADALGASTLAQKKRPRLVVELLCRWNGLALDKFDAVAIDGDPQLDAWGGTALVFRVLGRRYLWDAENPGQIALTLVEANG